MTAPRYAIYYAPALDSPWWRFGAGWLGWDESRRLELPQPQLDGLPVQEFHALTAEPRRYGFHATLKAPFRLRPGVDEEILIERVHRLARAVRGVPLGIMAPGRIDDFVALAPERRVPGVDALAWRCVTELDDLRAPLTPEEFARRKPESLPPRAREFLERFGYPWVVDLFRFHMTLSGPVDPAAADLLIERARERVDSLNREHPLELERLCIFREDHPGAPFARIDDAELGS